MCYGWDLEGAGRAPTRRHVSCSTGPCLSVEVGSGAATCLAAPEPTSLIRRALTMPCVPWLQTHWSTTCPMAPDPASLLGGLRASTRPAVLYEPRASSIKKRLAGLPVQLGLHVLNARAHVSKVPDVRAIMGLQDERAGSAFNARKTCGQADTVWLQCSTGPVDHLPGTATVPGNPIAWCHVAN
jgi:hypothetical protein